MITNSELGQRLSGFRDWAGLTQDQLARKLHISQSKLSRVESGEKTLTPGEMQRAMRVLPVQSIDQLLYDGLERGEEALVFQRQLRDHADLVDVAPAEFLTTKHFETPAAFSAAHLTSGRGQGVPCFKTSFQRLLSPYVGGLQRNMKQVMTATEDHAPCVLCIEEDDRVFRQLIQHSSAMQVVGMVVGWVHDCDQPLSVFLDNTIGATIPSSIKKTTIR